MQTELNRQPHPRNRANNPNATESQQLAELRAENIRLKGELEAIRHRAGMLLTDYVPEIEARRADYERLSKCLHFMTELESNREPGMLEIETVFTDSRDVLMRAFWKHLHALCCETLNWFDPRTFQKFYVEMRLWVDQLEYERTQQKPAA